MTPGRLALATLVLVSMPLAGAFAGTVLEITGPGVVGNPTNHLSVRVTFATNLSATPTVLVEGPGGTWRVPSTGILSPYPGTSHEIAVVGLSAGTTYDLHLSATGEGQWAAAPATLAYTPAALPAEFPEVVILASQPAAMQPGLTLFAANRDFPFTSVSWILAIDETGTILWYHEEDESITDITPLANGNLAYLGFTGDIVEIDILGTEVNRISHATLGVAPMHHEVYELDNGNFLTLSTELQVIGGYPGSNTYNVVGDTIVEVTPGGVLVEEISLFGILDPYRIPVQQSFNGNFWNAYYGTVTKDWTHGNAVIPDPADGGLILSLRHQDLVFKIDRQTTELVWVIGEDLDSTSGDDAWPFLAPQAGAVLPRHQHAPMLLDGDEILIYDNGNFNPEGEVTRPVIYHLDTVAQELDQTWEWIDPDYDPAIFCRYVGDADRLANGNILVTDGAVTDDTSLHSWIRIAEVTHPQATKVWEMAIGSQVDSVSWAGYRSDRIPGLYPAGPLFVDGFESGDPSAWSAVSR